MLELLKKQAKVFARRSFLMDKKDDTGVIFRYNHFADTCVSEEV